MVRRRGPRLTLAQKAELWRRWRHGESLNAIGRALGRLPKMVRYEVARTGGIPPAGAPSRPPRPDTVGRDCPQAQHAASQDTGLSHTGGYTRRHRRIQPLWCDDVARRTSRHERKEPR